MRIGYYAHHHGSGHCRQADKLAALLPSAWLQSLTVFTSLDTDAYTFKTITEAQIVRLSPEDERLDDVLPGRAGQYWQPECLHYSPVGNPDIQTRSWQLLDGMRQRNIDLMIIDVSVEVAMFCRAVSMPYLYVRLAGNRDDAPHLNAFAGALGLLVPYPQVLESAMTPNWIRQKSLYLDFLTSANAPNVTYDGFIDILTELPSHTNACKSIKTLAQHSDDIKKDKCRPLIVTVIKGYGGHEAIDAKLSELRSVMPNAFIISLGPIDDDKRNYVDIATHVSDVTPFIAHSDLLLMACGLNSIAQVYPYATPLIVLPDDRPHQEQELMADALITQGRALSWQQFMNQTSNTSEREIHQNILSSLSNTSKDIDTNPYKQNKDQYHCQNNGQSNAAAHTFMTSLTQYSSIKLWFQQWLLPQLDLIPERIK